MGNGAVHHIIILADMRYLCDCGMSMNVGIPCRHYFRVLQTVRDLPFHIGLVRSRCVSWSFIRVRVLLTSLEQMVPRPEP